MAAKKAQAKLFSFFTKAPAPVAAAKGALLFSGCKRDKQKASLDSFACGG